MDVTLAANFIDAADNTRLADAHAKWALTPIWKKSLRLPRRVGTATVKRLMFACATIDTKQALRVDLLKAVYPLDEFDAKVEQLGRDILANSAFSHAANKWIWDPTDGDSLEKT